MPTMHKQTAARHRPALALRRLAGAPLLWALCGAAPAQDAPRHYFDDPVLQVTTALPQCAPQEPSKITQAQMQANAEMAQIQSSLQLSDDQKNQVFTALYSGYAQQAGVDGATPAYDPTDIDGQFNAKEAAMQAVLTPEQFATYTKFVDSQKQMYKAILGGAAGH